MTCHNQWFPPPVLDSASQDKGWQWHDLGKGEEGKETEGQEGEKNFLNNKKWYNTLSTTSSLNKIELTVSTT